MMSDCQTAFVVRFTVYEHFIRIHVVYDHFIRIHVLSLHIILLTIKFKSIKNTLDNNTINIMV